MPDLDSLKWQTWCSSPILCLQEQRIVQDYAFRIHFTQCVPKMYNPKQYSWLSWGPSLSQASAVALITSGRRSWLRQGHSEALRCCWTTNGSLHEQCTVAQPFSPTRCPDVFSARNVECFFYFDLLLVLAEVPLFIVSKSLVYISKITSAHIKHSFSVTWH